MKQNNKKKNLYVIVCICAALMTANFCSTPAEKEKMDNKTVSNPLLSEFDTPFNVPPFDKIKNEHYLPAFQEGIKQQQKKIAAIVDNPSPPTFTNTIEALESSRALLTKVENVFRVLRSAHTNDAMQKTAKEVAPLMSGHEDDILLNEKLFKRVKAVYEKKDDLKLSAEQNKLIETYYKEFVRGGANLDAGKKAELRDTNTKLSLLSLKFSENILKENNAFELIIRQKEDLSGLTPVIIEGAAETAKELGHEGNWVFTLNKPSMLPFLQYSDKRELRESLFKAYINRGNNNDESDNKTILSQIASLRVKRAHLLGYRNHAEYILEENMAKKPENVYKLLKQLWTAALPIAQKEANELQAKIDEEGQNFKLQPWDWWYYSEKVKKAKYDLDDNILKPYFKLENVRDGAFYVAGKLYGLKFIERTDIPKYHRDVHVFEVRDAADSHIGVFYVDYFPRPNKKGGAWMNNFREQSRRGGKRIHPVVTNNGNFSKPVGDVPALLSAEEVETLFHEFGHGLHGLLADTVYEKLSGTNVPRDFVELPSQIMEHWAFEPEVLKVYAKHYKTGESIPQELADKIYLSKLFNQGFETVEYLAASFLDMDWHTITETGDFDVNKFESESLKKIALIPEIVVRYRSTFFNHIFSSGYSAGYYSYIWAEVLDCHAFEAFQETELFHGKTAQSFRENVLKRGGTEDPMLLYKRFRGKEPGIAPLLKKRFGIISEVK
jgi:peptidyl-dipeptidase Dcp